MFKTRHLILTVFLLPCSANLYASSFFDQFIDPEDGYFDGSEFLQNYKYGVMPVPIVITEPAVGAGGGLAAVYFHDPDPAWKGELFDAEGRQHPSSISAAAAAATSNGSEVLGGGHFGFYKEDTIRYEGVVGGADINLEFYGSGDDTNEDGFDFNAQALFISQKVAFRLGESDWFAGGEISYTDMTTKFDQRQQVPELEAISFDITNVSLGAILFYDSLNSPYTPSSGIKSQLEYDRYDESFGGDFDYNLVVWKNQFYFAPFENWTAGLRLDGNFVSGDVPFFALPYIELRGIPAMRYQGDDVITSEIQMNWNFHPRWSILGFFGAGHTADSLSDLSDASTESAGGFGFRYMGVRQLGLNMGIDFAKGPEESVVYVNFGTAF